jgi:crossover junction endodeoxyribonuclease RuvC
MRIAGIDPGLTGALAVVDGADRSTTRLTVVDAIDVPTIGESTKREVDVMALIGWLKRNEIDHAYIEYVNAMPSIPDKETGERRGMGAASAFKFGYITGQIRACIVGCKIPFTVISSAKWKKAHNLPGGAGNKEHSRQLAMRIFPDSHNLLARKRDEARAEAILIARYGILFGDHAYRAA